MTESEGTQATQGKWKLWLPIVISILIIVPLLYFFWSKWKFVLVLIVIGAIIVGIVLLVKQLKSKKVVKEAL